MANPDYYDLRKLRSLVEPPTKKQPVNLNTAYFNSERFVPKTQEAPKKKGKSK